ncbi:isocitrate lyase/phosphoenolpyruvate mutase family protein [Leuconostoc suionicum]|nr:isocitrate lyase/phosphoenolpyruvate mutase family protein [Leuconostoc suionicum]MDC2805151.1 isocitrate lyase/phosphoenolpyruvate mutase family protein [Leuconostoc suionicum]MDC2822663.1 isocitrate lyase/phosphoenolpyruvate mutase family protein [Leuconostoc suionicum]
MLEGQKFLKKGFQALATTSAGIAFANGFADGGELPFSILLETVRRITSKIDIPLSIDFERGYSEDIQEIYENTKKILLSGAVGLNVEDGLPKKRTRSRFCNQLENRYLLERNW